MKSADKTPTICQDRSLALALSRSRLTRANLNLAALVARQEAELQTAFATIRRLRLELFGVKLLAAALRSVRRRRAFCFPLLLLSALAFSLSTFAAFAASPVHKPSSRAATVNETLDMVLFVGSDWRGRHRSFTWGELEREAARRLKIQRREPWAQLPKK